MKRIQKAAADVIVLRFCPTYLYCRSEGNRRL